MISSRKIAGAFGLAMGASLAGCSSANLDEVAADDVVSQSSSLVGRLDSVRVFRLPTLTTSISALDSQNALPSGALSDPVLRGHLRALGSSRLQLAAPAVQALLLSARGPVLLKYLARCALSEGDLSLSASFPGRLGLAPEWSARLLTESEKRWMTACLMAHTNDMATVPIAVSGTLPAFRTTGYVTGESYRVEEGAFYGEIFKAQVLFACSGVGTQLLCSDRGVSADLQRRLCGTRSAAECGFTYMGECNKVSGGSLIANVCTTALPYSDCRGTGERRYSEVITTSLHTDVEALRLHPRCTQSVPPSCSHNVCTIGAPLASTCSAGVCKSDDYCCTIAWDSNCVAAAGCPAP